MAIIKRKTVFVPFEVWHSLSTSRRWQWLTILIAAAAIIAALILAKCAKDREVREAQATQKGRFAATLFRLPSGGSTSVVLGLDTRGIPAALRNSFSDGVTKELSKAFPEEDIVSDALLPDFYGQGYFAKAFAGDTAFVGETEFFKKTKTLLLSKPEISFGDSSLGGGMKSCTVDLAFRSYSSAQASARQAAVHLVGSGFSEETAMMDALGKLSAKKAELSPSLGDNQ